jgi:hypothetical protein
VDGTLPPDLWDESAELAVMVHLVFNYPAPAACAQLQATVGEYNRANRFLGLPQLPFDAERAMGRMGAVARYVSSLRGSTHIGAIYQLLLKRLAVEP